MGDLRQAILAAMNILDRPGNLIGAAESIRMRLEIDRLTEPKVANE